ncbi:hypothetical protein Tsubulata_045828 [Turnera subulata]|uniref:Uncharacterized protein n=1 Tax=Turnera subulata TaxID=218843 RepID=A0A9Q0GCA5_9ROSI|nr:hypothetical protein Tsubulata_045828 [Turnera subulata]
MESSEEKMRSAFDFYMNTVKLQLEKIISYPILFRYSIEDRALPKWNVLQLLKSHNLLRKDTKVTRWMALSEKYFSQRCVTRFADKIPELINVYLGYSQGKK